MITGTTTYHRLGDTGAQAVIEPPCPVSTEGHDWTDLVQTRAYRHRACDRPGCSWFASTTIPDGGTA